MTISIKASALLYNIIYACMILHTIFYFYDSTATPVPPAGLNYIEINPEDFELNECCMMDGRSSLLDLANAPPLLNDSEMMQMEVTASGEKRKATPPDLLTLSHMYFEKNQVNTPNSLLRRSF